MPRIVGHIDLDYFYAQVEEVENPSLKTRPVIVCVFSGRTEDSGVVSTANYVARALGVKAGIPISLAKKKLEGKDPAVIKMVHAKYEAVSERIMSLISTQVDALEPTGIDEAFFDITDRAGGDYEAAAAIAQSIKDSLKHEEGLTSSVGLGRSKAVAKLGSDAKKPDGLTVVKPEDTESFLSPLDVSKLYGVGPKTETALLELGLKTVGDLARADPTELERKIGRKLAAYLVQAASGNDSDQVTPGQGPTQFSRIVTLKRDTRDIGEVVAQLSDALAEVVSKASSSGRSFKTLTAICVLTDLSAHTKNHTFEAPQRDVAKLTEELRKLFAELGESVDKDFRRVGIRISGLSDSRDQVSLSEYIGG